MIPDLSSIFTRYEALRAEVDDLFGKVRGDYPQCVVCKEGCSDCCHALFDLSLVEAMYLHKAFEAAFAHGPERSAILERASDIDRLITRIKRDLYRAEKDGESKAISAWKKRQMRVCLFFVKALPLGATATTAASGGNREELLGPRPAGCKRQRSRRWEPQPGLVCEAD